MQFRKKPSSSAPDSGNTDPLWEKYLSLKKKYEAISALHELASQAGRLPETVVKTHLLDEIRSMLSSHEVGVTKQAEKGAMALDICCPDCGSKDHQRCPNSEEQPYKKWLDTLQRGS